MVGEDGLPLSSLASTSRPSAAFASLVMIT
jgi:hypothetical protein